MYTRVPERKTSSSVIKIPDNYSGNAFLGAGQYASIPEAPIAPPPMETAKETVEETPIIKNTESHENNPIQKDTLVATQKKAQSDSLLSSLFPSKSLKNHFPFGHGIGSEEILILGIMSLIFFSDDKEPDGELIMLLALLLFAG